MKPVTLTEDQSISARVRCGCARSDEHGWSLDPYACIEWQEGRVYVMCGYCGRTFFGDVQPMDRGNQA